MQEIQIVQCLNLIQSLARHLTGSAPVLINATSWDEVNLIPHAYVVSVGDLSASASNSDPKQALLDALVGLLVAVYTRLHNAQTNAALSGLQGAARQFSAVAALGF